MSKLSMSVALGCWLAFMPFDAMATPKEDLLSFVYDGVGLGLSVEQMEANLIEAGFVKTKDLPASRRNRYKRFLVFERGASGLSMGIPSPGEVAPGPAKEGERSNTISINVSDGEIIKIEAQILRREATFDVAGEIGLFMDALGEPFEPCSEKGSRITCHWADFPPDCIGSSCQGTSIGATFETNLARVVFYLTQ